MLMAIFAQKAARRGRRAEGRLRAEASERRPCPHPQGKTEGAPGGAGADEGEAHRLGDAPSHSRGK